MSRRLFMILVVFAACGPSEVGPDPGSGLPEVAEGEEQLILTVHNEARRRLGVMLPELVWSDRVAQSAQEYANQLAMKGCVLEHSASTSYGENLYWSSGPSTQRNVVDTWEGERACYTYGRFPDTCDMSKCAGGCGHYTQLVWRETTELGCGMAKCGAAEVWVCQYNARGNVVGQFPY